jgi:preprotein translocase subunit Sec61beta
MDIIAVGAAVSLLTEVAKTLLPPLPRKRLAPYIALAASLVATVLYILAAPVFPPARTQLWPLFLDWLTVYGTAVGIYHGAKLTKSR